MLESYAEEKLNRKDLENIKLETLKIEVMQKDEDEKFDGLERENTVSMTVPIRTFESEMSNQIPFQSWV